MKISILDIFKKTFMVIKDDSATVISYTKHPRKFNRPDGLYWFDSNTSTGINRIPLKSWKPTSVMEIFSIFI